MQIKNIEGLSVAQIKAIVADGGKFVYFPYTISLVLVTFQRNSSIYLVRSSESTIRHSYKYVLTNTILGWWSIPWGPIRTVGAMYHHICGGKDVTYEVVNELAQNDPEANTTSYNLPGFPSSTSQSTANERPTYTIPR